jgi:hypothetical protein
MWVKDSIPAYTIVDRTGKIVARRAARTQAFDLIIGRFNGVWLVRGLDRKPPPVSGIRIG